jgi:hypothetical protein
VLAIAAAIVQLILTLIRVGTVWTSSAEWKQYLVTTNNNLKAGNKNKKTNYTLDSPAVSHDLHSLHTGITGQSLLVVVAVALCAYAFWRGRGIARWLYIIASLFFSGTGITALSASSPKAFNVTWFLSAVAALIGIVLLIMPSSARYFAATKALRLPPASARAGAGAAGAAGGAGGAVPPRPPGLRGLFAPPPPRAPRAPAARPAAANTDPPGTGSSGTGAKRKPAATRPANKAGPSGSGNTGGPGGAAGGAGKSDVAARGKPKARSGADATTDAPVASSEAPPARARGKSRRV